MNIIEEIKAKLKNIEEIKDDIRFVAGNLFELTHLEDFIFEFEKLLGEETLIDCLVQVSTDEGNELEIGFYTNNRIADVTLSAGKVYFYAYPLSEIKTISLNDRGSKWTLTISGEKKFDYNIVKPGLCTSLCVYESSLRSYKSEEGKCV